MAHAVDNLVDAWNRTGEAIYKERLAQMHDGLLERNDGGWPNKFYDDMEWMAIAWLRAFYVTGEERYKQAALILWEDIKTGWNDHMGGGIAWRKPQLDYKNTPANAPAVILAARLYRAFGEPTDLAWAVIIYEWLTKNMVDPATGFVWDGMNRLGDGAIDKHWKFTYCQGVYIGAGLELYRVTQERVYLQSALRTAHAAIAELADSGTSLLPPEGTGDGGLFKGIFVRYLTELILAVNDPGDAGDIGDMRGSAELAGVAGLTGPEDLVERTEWTGAAGLVNQMEWTGLTDLAEVSELIHLMKSNADAIWNQGRQDDLPLFGNHWNQPAEGKVDLSTQLSGVMLLEMMAELERAGAE
jgi:predicted alpha-1,6-mannanase (GH76 family)